MAHYQKLLTIPSTPKSFVKITSQIKSIVLVLGTWQGIYLWEHRQHRYNRELFIHINGD